MIDPLLLPTLDADRESWVASANRADTDFPLQNLPFGRFVHPSDPRQSRLAVAIGDQLLDLTQAASTGHWSPEVQPLMERLAQGSLLPLMAQGPQARSAVRRALSDALARDGQTALETCLIPQAAVQMLLPCPIGDYTDFYIGIHHATAVGRMFRPDNPLLPNYRWVPIGYHGRASTIVPSGMPFHRPAGQQMPPGATAPQFGPCQRLDFELEMGVLIGQSNPMGQPVSMDAAEAAVFGFTLFNDWSARDLQAWEYQPLGPFLSKSFASTLSPWVVTPEALVPFRRPFLRAEGEPQPLPYLDSPGNRARGAFDIDLCIAMQTAAMRAQGLAPVTISRSNFAEAAYWTVAQLVAHHTVNGCALQPGDLFGSGTLSGITPDRAGSLLELTEGGKRPITLPTGETRRFLEDGDSITFTGRCHREGYRSIGFGMCEGTVLPARTSV